MRYRINCDRTMYKSKFPKKINAASQQRLNSLLPELNRQRTLLKWQHVGLTFGLSVGIALLFSVILYGLGWVVVWIRRGFNQS